jgi:hypothetical protein
MKYLIVEKLEDKYINLFEVWVFIRAVEYSALEITEHLKCRLYLNIDLRESFVYLEIWFPKSKKNEKIEILRTLWYNVRFFPREWEPIIFDEIWTNIKRNKNDLLAKKKELVKF